MSANYGMNSVLSRREMHCLNNRLKSEINRLSTDLLRFKLLSIRYQKYIDFLEEINATIVGFEVNNEFKKQINELKVNKCFVSLNELQISCDINDDSIGNSFKKLVLIQYSIDLSFFNSINSFGKQKK